MKKRVRRGDISRGLLESPLPTMILIELGMSNMDSMGEMGGIGVLIARGNIDSMAHVNSQGCSGYEYGWVGAMESR